MTTENITKPSVVVMTYPGLHGVNVLNNFHRNKDINVVGVVLSGRLYKNKNYFQNAYAVYSRMGLAFMLYLFLMHDLAWLIANLFRKPEILSSSVPVLTTKDVNSPETQSFIRRLAPDYVASCYFNQVIGPEIWNIPKVECVNGHNALLPAMRGACAAFRVIERGAVHVGATVHRVEKGLDEGEIFYQEPFSLDSNKDLMLVDHKMWDQTSRVLSEWIGGKGQTGFEHVVQKDVTPPDYDTFPNPVEVRKFRKSGFSLLSLFSLVSIFRMTFK